MALGKSNPNPRPRPHSYREIRERREKIQLLMSRGMNQAKIASELGVTRMTINRDIHYINEMSRHGLYGIGKTAATLVYNCIQGLDECLDVCWRIHDNPDNNPEINQWHKIAAVRLAASINEKKFNIVMNGPSVLELATLEKRVNTLKQDFFSVSNTTNVNDMI
jgi:DeoR/GlpR family transcriptional regulator of sugar metabolism